MKHPVLKAEKRTVLGKKVKHLRRHGLLPANVYGKGLESTAIQVKTPEFNEIFKEVGETGLIDLQFEGKTHPVLVKNLQMNFRENFPLHVDFYQVNLKEKVKTMVPLEVIGEAKAVTEKTGLLLQSINEVEVEALPEALPERIEVSVENLAAIGDQLTVADLTIPEGVEVLTDSGQIVVRIDEMVTKEAEEEIAAEEAASEAASESTEGEAGEEGQEPKEESSEESKEE